MDISILITTYNLSSYIDETLASVMRQKTDASFEVLVGDDGSTDDTVAKVSLWQEKYPGRIRVYVMDRDPSVQYQRIARASKNRLRLIRHARGRYLMFLDGDDFYTDDTKLEKQFRFLEAPEHAEIIACGHNIDIFRSGEKSRPMNRRRNAAVFSASDYWKYGMYMHSDTLMFRNVYEKSRGAELPENYYDDNMILFCLLKYGRIAYLSDSMAAYRQLDNSSWNSVDSLEKSIINLMDLDVELVTDRRFRRESITRHLYPVWDLFRNRKRIPEELKEKYRAQVKRDRLSWTAHWLFYEKQPAAVRLRMCCFLITRLFGYVFLKLRRRICGKTL